MEAENPLVRQRRVSGQQRQRNRVGRGWWRQGRGVRWGLLAWSFEGLLKQRSVARWVGEHGAFAGQGLLAWGFMGQRPLRWKSDADQQTWP